MAKKRSAESYTGNTEEAKKRQRANLIPGNRWDKRRRKEMRLDCWWWTFPLGNIQDIYEIWTNDRGFEDTPKDELKDEEFIDKWWDNLTIENKEVIVKNCEGAYRAKDEEEHKRLIEKLLEEQIKEEKLADEKLGK